MGLIYSKCSQKIVRNKKIRIIMLGMDSGGKTTILYKLRLGEIITSIPIICFNIESVECTRFSIMSCDLDRRGGLEPPWIKLFQEPMHGLIFVLDSNDHENVDLARTELQKILRKDLFIGLPLLIIANKQDMPNALSIDELTEKMELHAIRGRNWYIKGTCALSGEGLHDAIKWILQSIEESY